MTDLVCFPEEPTFDDHIFQILCAIEDSQRRTIAIVGSRGYQNSALIRLLVSHIPDDATLISGGAKGPDSVAQQEAEQRGINTDIHLPEWSRYGKSAGPRRNALIVNQADILVAFWDLRSKGTDNAIRLAQVANIPVFIFDKNGNRKNDYERRGSPRSRSTSKHPRRAADFKHAKPPKHLRSPKPNA